MEITSLIDTIERFWNNINASCAGRLLCAVGIAFPFFSGKVLERFSSYLITPILKHTQKILKKGEIFLLNMRIQQFLRFILLYMVVLYSDFPDS
ncbi:MAG: hypothetical protein LBH38_01865, partial [Holosporales bacterium]|nr:hypothetical protein [Holosporales bacterium]